VFKATPVSQNCKK